VRTDSASARNASADERSAWICARVIVVCECEDGAQGMDRSRQGQDQDHGAKEMDNDWTKITRISDIIGPKTTVKDAKQNITKAECGIREIAFRKIRGICATAAPLRWPFGGGDPTTRDANRQLFHIRPAVMLVLLVPVLLLLLLLLLLIDQQNVLAIMVLLLPLLPMPMQVHVRKLLMLAIQSSVQTSAMTSVKTRRVRLSLLETPGHWYLCQCQC
jgi:hypothetical protein